MELRLPRLLLALILAAISPACAQESPPQNMKLFLLVGQSNMAGRGVVEPQDQVINPRIWMLTKDNSWKPAKDPLHFDKPAMAGVGLGSEFARTIARQTPNITIGLIPCAVGGTSLDQWAPGGELYTNAVTRAKAAQKNGTVAGILWHQGEADSSDAKVATYPERFLKMIGQLRQDVGAPDAPVVLGELGHMKPTRAAFNAMLPSLVKRVPLAAMANANDLTDKGDRTHFDSKSLRIFGRRYAEAWLKLQARN